MTLDADTLRAYDDERDALRQEIMFLKFERNRLQVERAKAWESFHRAKRQCSCGAFGSSIDEDEGDR